LLGLATGIAWGFVAAIIKELSSHLSGGIGAVFSTWSLYVLLAVGAGAMLLASHALAAGPLAASQPGFTILDPLAASLLGVFLFGEHIRTDAAALAGQALALAVVIAGAAALSRSSLIAGENEGPAQHPAAPASAASSAPATRPPSDPADPPVPGRYPTRRPAALSPDVAVRVGQTRPGPAPAATRIGPPGPARAHQNLDPEQAAA